MKRDWVPLVIVSAFVLMSVFTLKSNKVYADTGQEGATRIENGVVFNSSQTTINSCYQGPVIKIWAGNPNTACLLIHNLSPNLQVAISSYSVMLATQTWIIDVSSQPGSTIQLQQFTGNLFSCGPSWVAAGLTASSPTIQTGSCGTMQPVFGKP